MFVETVKSFGISLLLCAALKFYVIKFNMYSVEVQPMILGIVEAYFACGSCLFWIKRFLYAIVSRVKVVSIRGVRVVGCSGITVISLSVVM